MWGTGDWRNALAISLVVVAGCGRVGFEAVSPADTDGGTSMRERAGDAALGARADAAWFDAPPTNDGPALSPEAGAAADMPPADAQVDGSAGDGDGDAGGPPADAAVIADGAQSDRVAPSEVGAASCPADAVFCEDFETLTLPLSAGSPYALMQTSGSNVSISTASARSGARALRVLVHPEPGRRTGSAGLRRTYAPVSHGTLYVRTHLWVGAGAAPQDYVVLVELQGATNRDGDQKTSIDIWTRDDLTLTSTASQVYLQAAPMTVPRGRWFCLEMQLTLGAAGGGGVIEMFLDGSSLLKSATGVNTIPSGGWVSATVGVNHVSGIGQDLELFYDDFIVSRSRVGCR